jgi:hypothetical protein
VLPAYYICTQRTLWNHRMDSVLTVYFCTIDVLYSYTRFIIILYYITGKQSVGSWIKMIKTVQCLMQHVARLNILFVLYPLKLSILHDFSLVHYSVCINRMTLWRVPKLTRLYGFTFNTTSERIWCRYTFFIFYFCTDFDFIRVITLIIGRTTHYGI